jgi:hypothetical protein
MGFLEDYDIDPYAFLGVKRMCQDPQEIKKAYKVKCLLFHPDKTMGKTDYEFKVLCKCYKHVMKNITEIQKDHSEMKLEHQAAQKAAQETALKTGRKAPTSQASDLHLFDTDRDLLFHQDTLDRDFSKTIKRVSSLSTAYSPLDSYNSTFKDKLQRPDGKFNREKFNVLFSEIKGKKKDASLVKYAGPVAANELQDSMVCVHVDDDGLILNSVSSVEFENEPTVSQEQIDRILEIDIKKIDAMIKKSKKDTGKITRKKFKEAVAAQTNRTLPEITEKRSYSEMERILEEKKLEELQNSRKAQAKYVSSHKIFRSIK